jgi:hypothetical protein
MTEGLDKLPLLISADQAAKGILAAARGRGGTAYVPGVWRWIMLLVRNIPSYLFKKLNV